MPDTKIESKKSVYKSPPSKLLTFFRKSRDNWKEKYKEAKLNIKRLSDKVRYWKNRADDLKIQVKELENQLKEEQKKLLNSVETTEKFKEAPAFHKYSYDHIYFYLQLVLEACVSMRGSSRVLNIVNSFFELGIDMPSWSTGRLWLLRIGLYKLERAKTIADDWIWIIDHTDQLGNQKCMVILGIRQKMLPNGELHLTHEDVEPIALIPVEKSNGEVVFQTKNCIGLLDIRMLLTV